jgi:hypothetical protein
MSLKKQLKEKKTFINQSEKKIRIIGNILDVNSTKLNALKSNFNDY